MDELSTYGGAARRARRLGAGLALGAGVLAVAAGPAGTAPDARPFALRVEGTSVTDPASCAPVGLTVVCDLANQGAGNGRHLGRSTATGTGTVTIDLLSHCTLDGRDGVVVTAAYTWGVTAADGSMLSADVVTTTCGTGSSRSPGEGTYVVTGGSGRFADATGSGTVAVIVDAGRLEATWEGTLGY